MPSRSRRGLTGVTFDLWNTLVFEDGDALVPARLAAIAGLLDERGESRGEDVLAAAHQMAFARYQTAWIGNQQFVVEDAAALMADELGLGAEYSAVLVEGMCAGGRAAVLRVCDGAVDCLATIRGQGLKTAIICDIGLTPSFVLMEWLERFQLHDAFDAFVFSDVVGTYKPEPAVFRAALQAMGDLRASDVAHVGDRRRTDVEGALNSGLLAVRYRGVFDDVDETFTEAPVIIDSLSELPSALGLRHVSSVGPNERVEQTRRT